MSLGALASLGSAGLSFAGGLIANHANRSESSRNRQFQENMSNTAYQRTVADMKKAGINPILSAKLGGASTPSGSQATHMNSAKDAANTYNQAKLVEAQINNIEMDTSLKHEQADLTNFQRGKMAWEVNKLTQDIELIKNNALGVSQQNKLRQIDVDMFSNAEILKNAKSLGIKPEQFKGLLNLLMKKGK